MTVWTWVHMLALGCAVGGVLAISSGQRAGDRPPSPDEVEARDVGGLPHVVAFTAEVLSGGRPEGTQAYQTLQGWGVRTIVTVDGLPAELDLARTADLHVMHLPLGYGRPTHDDVLKITSALGAALARGAVYVHCHQGRHRSAAASAIGLIGLGRADVDAMCARMAVAGTDEGYVGLWSAVRQAKVLDPSSLMPIDAIPDRVKPMGLTATMLVAQDALDRLVDHQRVDWTSNHAVEVSGRLTEVLRGLHRSADIERFGPEGAILAEATVEASASLEVLLVEDRHDQAARVLARLEASCTACHRATR